jgi:HEAT repeat protein/energy-coupling factor transporter ATP-binding protein EcfA2
MSNDEPKLIIFVSSMIGPLWDERAAVEEAIRTGIPLARTWVFERAPASSEEITESYLAHVRECDIYLLILGEDISDPVKAEYQTAVECDKPRLCFVQEGVERTPALEEFLPTLQADVKYAPFSDEAGLRREVLQAVRLELVRGYKAYHLQAAERLQVAQDIEVPPEIRQELMRTTYLDKIADDCRYVEPRDLRIPLTEVFVMLQAVERKREEPLREDVAPLKEREREAGLLERLFTHRKPREAEKMMMRERPVPPPPPPPVELSKALQEHDHLVLLGEPGAGKTTTLQYIALLLAEGRGEELGLDGDSIPVHLKLSEHGEGLGERRLDEFLKGCLHSYYVSPQQADVWLKEGRLILLFDALDEVRPEERQRRVLEAIRNFSLTPEGKRTRIVLSSRLPAYRATTGISGDFGHYIVCPFTKPEETLPYAANWFTALGKIPNVEAKGRAQELLNDMQKQPGLRRVMSNPLLLRLAIEVYLREAEPVSSRAELYGRYIEETRKRARLREDPSIWKVDVKTEQEEQQALETALETIAWKIFVEGEYGKETLCQTVEEELTVNDHKKVDGTKLVEYLRRAMGILIFYLGEKEKELFLFSHFSFCEYFVALHLARCWRKDEKRTWRFLKPRLHHPAWREPILLLAGELDEKETARLVRRMLRARSPYERFLHRDLFLVTALIGHGAKVGEETAQKAGRRIVRWLRADGLRWQAAEALVEMGKPAVPYLIAALGDESRDTRMAAAKALGEMKAQEAVPHLIKALHGWGAVRRAAAKALGEMKAQEAVPHLKAALVGSDDYMCLAAAKALGEIGVPAVPHLIEALGHGSESAAKALGELKAQESVPHLIEALGHGSESVREAAAEALGELKAQESVPHLIEALGDEYKSLLDRYPVREAAAKALGELKAQESVPHLIEVLGDGNGVVRRAAARALGKLKAQEAIPYLIEALGDESRGTCMAAVEALGELKAQEEAVPYLIEALGDESWGMRAVAARALGRLKAQEAIPYLKAALVGRGDEYMCLVAVEALEEIAEPAVPHLIEALGHEWKFVREAAAKALGELKAQEAVPHLIKALGDRNEDMRRAAAEALGKLSEEITTSKAHSVAWALAIAPMTLKVISKEILEYLLKLFFIVLVLLLISICSQPLNYIELLFCVRTCIFLSVIIAFISRLIRYTTGSAWAHEPLKQVVSRITELEVAKLPPEDPCAVPGRGK